MGRQKGSKRRLRPLPLLLAAAQVQRHGAAVAPGPVDRRALAARPQPRIDAHHGLLAQGRRQQQVAQIAREHLHRLRVGPGFDVGEHGFLDARTQQAFGALVDGRGQLSAPRRAMVQADKLADSCQQPIAIDGHVDPQHALGGAALHGQKTMRGEAVQRLLKVVPRLKTGRPLLLGFCHLLRDRLRGQRALAVGLPGHRPHVGALRHRLSDDVARALQRVVHRRDGAIGVLGVGPHKGPRVALRIAVGRLPQHQLGQRRQAAIPRHRRPRAALLFVGQVEVFQLGLGADSPDLQAQRRGELALLLDRSPHGRAARF